MPTNHAIDERTQILDVLGVTVEFLTPQQERGVYSVMKGIIPAGMSVPLHSHPDAESFYVVAGNGQVLIERERRLEWVDVITGDFVHITRRSHSGGRDGDCN